MHPVLRFKGFTDSWKICKLRDVCKGFDYGIGASATEYDGVHKYIRITDIDENSHKFIADPIVSPDCIPERKYLVTSNDILFARTGASTGKTYLYDEKDKPLYFAGFLIRLNVSGADPYFVFYNTLTRSYNNWIKLTSTRSGQPGINSEELKNYSFSCPSIEEQTKIATFLNLYYKKIELQKKKVGLLKLQEHQIINNIFKIENQTCLVKLSKLLNQISKKNKDNLNFPVLSVSNKFGFIPQNEQFEEEVASEDKSNYKLVKPNQFAYNPARINVGSIAMLTKPYTIGQISPMYVCFECAPMLNSDYFGYYLRSSSFKKEMQKRLEGSVRMCLTFESMCNIKVSLPGIKEQLLVVKKLKKFDSKIKTEENKLLLLEQYKQGLLQKMFI